MNEDTLRPDPDALLGKIKAEEEKAKRGKLKIFFGSSAGVGKTYAMLSAAREKNAEGIDVVVGLVETHKRPETEKLLEGLQILLPRKIDYRGVTLRELDLDGILERKPEIALIDELAHTNAPTMRHPKRWNDVVEILDAGIDVYTTLNVQHIESLADVVAGSTGVWVKETVPDSIFDEADDIVLVDINADELLKRLEEGKVYVAPQVKAHAAENFFRKSNLIALRELALRRTAERVDAQMDAYNDSEGLRDRASISDKILVCIGPDPLSAKLVRTTKRMASGLKAQWTAIYVENARSHRLDELSRRKVESLFRMVERIGGKSVVVQGDNAEDEIIAHARIHNFSKVVVGKPIKSRWRNFIEGTLSDKIIQKSGNLDVYVVTGQAEKHEESDLSERLAALKPMPYVWALVLVAFFTIFGIFTDAILDPIDQALIYLTGIVLIAVKHGRGPSFFYALLSAAAFNIFFLTPQHAYGSEDRSYLITFLVMLIMGYVIANQASKLRTQMLLARERELHTQTLYRLTRELTGSRGRQRVSEVVAKHVAEMLDAEITVWLTDEDKHLAPIVGELPASDYVKERSVVQWCFDNAKLAGKNTTTMPSAEGFYLPLIGSNETLGVFGVTLRDNERQLSLDEISTLETIVSLLASAQERVRAGEVVLKTRIAEESEKIRESLIKSHKEVTGIPL